jgi:NADP-dependent 3-hydroxy acid dehydrogenase YdfG
MTPAAPLAVVTGGGSGLGLALARELSRRGYRLALVGRRLAVLREIAPTLEGPSESYECDVRDAVSVLACARQVEARQGLASVVVPAAGTARIGALEALSNADLEAV